MKVSKDSQQGLFWLCVFLIAGLVMIIVLK
jgi:hypothetical protein